MPNEEKIKRILRESVQPGKYVSERQLTEVVGHVVELDHLDEAGIQKIANEVVRDPKAFVVRSIDMSDINDELQR